MGYGTQLSIVPAVSIALDIYLPKCVLYGPGEEE
jgi:hypothetical protein